jgi:glycosyltransferase involved in cell wall biosynthesis
MANVMADYSFGISICKENAGPSLKAAMPTKIAEFLAIGRPVVVNEGLGDCDELFSDGKAGIILKLSDNLKEKARDLVNLCMDPNTPINCRSLAENNFSLDNGVENYLDIYKRMRQ